MIVLKIEIVYTFWHTFLLRY